MSYIATTKLRSSCFLEILRRCSLSPGDTIISSSTGCTVVNIIYTIVFGSRHEVDDQEFKASIEFFKLLNEVLSETAALVHLPWLRYLPIKSLKEGLDKLARCIEIGDPIFEKKLDDHRSTLTPDRIRDLADAILKEADDAIKEDRSIKNYLTDNHINLIAADVFTAGADTTIGSLRWAFV